MPETESQKKATKRWIDKNPEHKRYMSKRSSARSFIRVACYADLLELKKMIENKLGETQDEA